jgi:recombination associated protein RdgC
VFKNLTLYRLPRGWSPTLDQLETALARERFAPCSASQDQSSGWIEPRGIAHGPLVESVDGQRILRFQIEAKTVPGAVVRRKAQEAADQIEATTGRRPGKKEMRALREEARQALLPQAFARQSQVWVWIDPHGGWLATDTTAQGKNDAVLSALVNHLDGFAALPLHTHLSPQAAMTQWLLAPSPDEWPGGLAIGRECELRSQDEEKSIVRFTRHHLLTDEVRKHIAEGKLPTRLALDWEGRVAFVLTESLQLRKLRFLEGVFEEAAAVTEGDDPFDTNVALATGELRGLIAALVEALGGLAADVLTGLGPSPRDAAGDAPAARNGDDPPF